MKEISFIVRATLGFASLSVIIFILSSLTVNAIFFGGANRGKKFNRFTSIEDDPPPPAGSGGVYWVGPSGSAGASGTYSDPWSLAYAETNSILRANDYVAFRSGSYTVGTTNLVVVNPSEPPVESDGIVYDAFVLQIR